MSRSIRFLAAMSLLVFAFSSAAEQSAYRLIRDARPDGRTVPVSNLTLKRDVYEFTFRSGAFHFLAPVENRTFAAVFIGDGSFKLLPATENERRHIALVTGDSEAEILTDDFDSLVLFFTDGTAEEIAKHAAIQPGSANAQATSIYTSYLDLQKKKYQLNLHLRVLQDLLNQAKEGVFLAPVDGKKLAPALIAVDPLGVGNLGAGFGFMGGEQTTFFSVDEENGGFWYLSAKKGEAVPGRGRALPQLVDAIHYDIDTEIASNLEIGGTTKIRVKPVMKNIRVLPIYIAPKLKIKAASATINGANVAAEIVQEEPEMGKLARLFREEVADSNAALVFANPLPDAGEYEITVSYEGRDVLRSVGVDTYSVRARESWYPNVGTFTDLATYSLTYRFPKRASLVSSGKLIEEKDGDQKVSRWQSDRPLRVVGFNYGKFEKITENDQPSGLQLDVYTNRDWRKMARDTMADAQNSARVATIFFGKAPYPHVAVTQQAEWNFGQSWPSLVFLPTLALTTSTDRALMLEQAGPEAMYGLNEFAKTVGWHEMAHQWWGHLVGWESYRDQWLSEGFAEFTSALVLQFTENLKKYEEFMEQKRQTILQKQRGATVANNDAGAISQGFRLSTKQAPGGHSAITYEKGAYVLHMLRMLFRDPSKQNADEKFMAMMQDFVTTYSGKNPSTADFQKIVEKHMTPQMNAAGNGKMDWFFKQWVHGTDVPKFKTDLKIEPGEGGKYRLTGSVSQESVPADFITLVPLYVEFPGGDVAKIGQLRLMGTAPQPVTAELPLPKKPKRVVVNALHDVLAR